MGMYEITWNEIEIGQNPAVNKVYFDDKRPKS